jgi:hypothetical protein
MVNIHEVSRRGFFKWCAAAATVANAQTTDLISPRTQGARADGETSDTKSIQSAIDLAHQRGGGTIHLDAGRYLSGTLNWRSNVSIWLDNGATLVMSSDAKDFSGALLNGDDAESIAIFGQGTIDCNRTKGGGPKPITLRRCRRASIRGITMRSAPSYNISLLGCDYVDIDAVTILNGFSDGIDPDSSHYVRISNCFIESVDDAIPLKATGLGERRSTEHVTVTNCVLRTASIHLKCGTESCGDFRNIAFSNCTLVGGMGMRHGNPGIALYTVDGGALQDIVVSNITMRDVGIPIAILRGNRDRCNGGGPPGIAGAIQISNVRASGAKLPSVIAGIPGAPVVGVRLDGISISTAPYASTRAIPKSLADIPEKTKDYPDPTMFGGLPAHGLFLRHAKDVVMRDVRFDCPSDEQRPAFVADDAETLRLANFEGSMWLNDVRDSEIECDRKIRLSGSKSDALFFRATRHFDREKNLTIGSEVPPGAVIVR